MKILLLGVQLTSLTNFRGPLIRDLIAAGHEVVAAAPEPVEPWLSRLLALGARYIEVPLERAGINPLADARLFAWLYQLCRREKPDLVLAFQAKAVIYGVPAAWFAGVKRRAIMIEGLGQAFSDRPVHGFKRRILAAVMPLLYWFSVKTAQLVFFLNPEDVQEFAQRGITFKRQKIVQIDGIGVDLAHFAHCALPALPPVQSFTFLMIARLLIDKGVEVYAEAACLVRQKHPEVVFQLLGPFDDTPAGVSRSAVAKWSEVQYLGETADVRPALMNCHVFVLPTFYREGLPRSLLEAMAIGRPLITTNVTGARMTVLEGDNGFLVKPCSATDLAAAMLKIVEAPSRLAPMGTASRKLAEERFEVGQINRQIITALMDI